MRSEPCVVQCTSDWPRGRQHASAVSASRSMGGKQSTSSSGRPSQPGAGDSRAAAGPLASLLSPVSTSSGDPRLRARSLSSVLSIPAPSQSPESPVESGSSTPDGTPFGRVFAAHSLPVHLVSFNGEPSPSARNPVSRPPAGVRPARPLQWVSVGPPLVPDWATRSCIAAVARALPLALGFDQPSPREVMRWRVIPK